MLCHVSLLCVLLSSSFLALGLWALALALASTLGGMRGFPAFWSSL
jgi:hypothetical protein